MNRRPPEATPGCIAMLRDLRRGGVALAVSGDRLTFRGPSETLTPAVLGALRSRKAELVAVLRGDYLRAAAALVTSAEADPARQLELAERFDERAAICEHDGCLSRGEAERVAYLELDAR